MQLEAFDRPVRILFVDDDEDDFVITRDSLTSIPDFHFQIDWASTFESAVDKLLQNEHDLCLLDYRLGERDGIELMHRVTDMNCQVPFILLTGRGNREIDLEAMKSGAMFYVDKHHLDAFDLERAIRYSLERVQMLREVQDMNAELERRVVERTRLLIQAKELLEAELAEREKMEVELRTLRHERQRQALQQISRPPKTSVTSTVLGLRTLHESAPNIFEMLVERYGMLIDLAVDQQIYRVQHPISDELRTLAGEIGTLRLSPRDVVEIHNVVLKNRQAGITPEKAESYIEEGRLMVLELMGYLAAYYRNYATGGTDQNVEPGT